MTSKLIFSLCALAPSLLATASDARASKPHPNIVIVMADDLGFSDLGCYGGEIQTPNLDSLAVGGLKYLNFYNTARCCPSRASLMTGKYQHAVGMGWMTAVDEHRAGYRGQLSFDHPTLPELLKSIGYQTYMSGKWHLTVDTNFRDPDVVPNGSWPTQRGFDEFFGGLSGGGSYFRPDSLARNLQRIPKKTLPEDYYYTDEITKHAIQFIENASPDMPMFLYVAHYAPHRPLQAPEGRIARCRERYQVGYEQLRRARFARQRELGFFGKEVPLGNPGMKLSYKPPAWGDLSVKARKKWTEEMATYAAMVEILDDGVGAIVAALKARNQLDNTLILFLSDNGGTKEGGLNAQLRGDLCNTPYRTYKQYTHLGGVASPLIVHWPEAVRDRGGLRRSPTHIIDILPTCIDIMGQPYPESFHGEPLKPLHGIAFTITLDDDAPLKPRTLYWEHQASRAVQSDGWRLVSLDKEEPWELYDLRTDPFEQHNLIEKHPGKVAELANRWQEWAASHQVLPLENKSWNKRIKHYQSLTKNATN